MTAEQDILFIYGSDEFAIARRVRESRAVFANASEAEMNTAVLDARSMTDEQWVNAVNAMPFLAAQRLVILENPSARFVQRLSRASTSREKDAGDEKDGSESEEKASLPEPKAEAAALAAVRRTRFLESLEHVPPSTHLVIWEVVEDRGAEKHWLAMWMRKKHLHVEFLVQPGTKMMDGWILKEARAQGGEFTPQAADKLREQVGSDTRQAAQEVTKLLTYVEWKRPVTPADVQALTPRTAEAVIWDLVEALSAGDGTKAQSLLHRFLEDDEQFYVWSMIIRQFRLMILAREVLDAHGGVPEAMSALRMARYPAEKGLNAARRFNMPRLEAIYKRLLEIDEAAKTGVMPLEVSLDLLVAELTQK